MQTTLIWWAAGTSLFGCVGHIFIAGHRVVKPLLAATDLAAEPKWINYLCWHFTTLLVLAMSMGFAYVALHPDRPELAVLFTVMSAAMSVLSVAVVIKGKISPFSFPGIGLFAIIAALGATGLTT